MSGKYDPPAPPPPEGPKKLPSWVIAILIVAGILVIGFGICVSMLSSIGG